MASTINATTSSGIVATADNTGQLALQAAGTTIATISSTGLTMNSGNIIQASGAAPAFSAYQSSGQTLGTATYTKILFQTEEWDTNSNFASSIFTPTVAGYYQINAVVRAPQNGEISIIIYKNGSNYKVGNNVNTNSVYSMGVSALVYFNGSTDYVEIYVFSSAASTPTVTGANYTYFQGYLARSA